MSTAVEIRHDGYLVRRGGESRADGQIVPDKQAAVTVALGIGLPIYITQNGRFVQVIRTQPGKA